MFEEEVLQLTSKLVSIESTNKGTFEGAVGEFIQTWLKANTHAEVTTQEFLPSRFNVLATYKGQVAHPNLLYVCHMDTVPIGDGWTCDPFQTTIRDGRMYGRGTNDMKSGLAAAMIAFRDITNEFYDKNILPRYDFIFIASGDEEDVMVGADRLCTSGVATHDSLVLDMEPSLMFGGKGIVDSTVALFGHKGKTWFEITTEGKTAHGSLPDRGIDAVAAMAEIISEIRQAITKYPEDPVMGRPTVCFGRIQGGVNTNMVPDKCSLWIDMRLAPPLSVESSKQLVADAIVTGTGRVPGSKGSFNCFAERPFVLINEHSTLLAELDKASRQVFGKPCKPVVFNGYTDSGVIAGRCGNGECMSFGPSGDQVHQPDEYVDCQTVLDCLEVYKLVARNILAK